MSEKSLQTSEKIINASKKVFAEKGLAGARMRQIAKEAGVNQALLHYYFGSKEKLYQEVIYHVVRDIMQSLATNFNPSESVDVAFDRFIHGYIDILKDNSEFPRLIVSEIIEGARNITPALDRVFNEVGFTPPTFFAPVIKSAIEKGVIREVDPMQTVISVMGMCLLYFIAKPVIQYVWDGPKDETLFLEDRKRAIVDLVLHGVLKSGNGDKEK